MAKKNIENDQTRDGELPPPSPAGVYDEDEGGLTSKDQSLLAKALRFLVNVQKPAYARIAQAHGYNGKEHTEGWHLHRAASGESQALAVVFGMATAQPALDDAQMPTLRAIDAFENLWFPRTRAIIQRVVPAEHAERFEASFFHELSQQPLGPEVITSVSTYVARLEALETSKEVGAHEVRETLRQRGLTREAVNTVKAQIASLRTLMPATAVKPVDANAVANARAEQRDALTKLRAWYNDWAAMLRPVYSRRQLLTLGLVTASRATDEAEEPVTPTPPA